MAEIFLGTRYLRTSVAERQLPFIELVLGVSSWQELTLEVPYLSLSPAQGETRTGFGDAVVGTKLLVLREQARRPGIALSGEAKLDNGDAGRGLGAGAVDYDVRLRTQKTWAWFTGLWNVGYTVVGEPVINDVRQERRNALFLAFAQEYKVAARTKLLSEVYWRESATPGESARLAADVGIKHNVRPWLQLHAAAGKSLRSGNAGGPRLRVYAGLMIEFPLFSNTSKPRLPQTSQGGKP
ncbi:MAG: transporter [Elusimicrobia bacterium]|nr:transporter [Elusimicrobiota bacterium]